MGQSAHEPFKRSSSICHSSVGLLDVSYVGLQSQMLWGLISRLLTLKVGVPGVGYHPFLFLREKPLILCFLTIVGHSTRVGVYGEIVSQSFLHTSLWFPYHLSDVKASLHQFWDFFQRKLFHI